MRILNKWLICCAAIALSIVIFPRGIEFSNFWAVVLGLGTVLWLINLLIRPVAQAASIVVTLLTLGIFSIIVNAAMVWLADLIVPAVEIKSFWICLFIAILISCGNTLFASKYLLK
jgi:putative membrane protein